MPTNLNAPIPATHHSAQVAAGHDRRPAPERPRERLLAHGPQVLTSAELLAIVLRTGIKAAMRSRLVVGSSTTVAV